MFSMATRALRRPLFVIAGLCISFAGCSSGNDASSSATTAPQISADDIQFLESQSMLFQAGEQDKRVSGSGDQWMHHYEDPLPLDAVKTASVWLLHYPGAVIPEPGKSIIGTWADPTFWDAMRDIGVEMLHTNPVQRAGGIEGRNFTPTIDGWFDRISQEIDPQLGNEQEYRGMVKVAGDHGAVIGGDLVPLHTGLGADFRLATRAFKDYPGVYTMSEIRQEDWGLLPGVNNENATALVSKETGTTLVNKGYIPGIINPADANPAVKASSGWSATGEIAGVDGKTRRWVYLHVFKPQQPVLNWSDPSYGGRRVAIGDAVRNIHDLGNKVVRLDAVPFLGIDPTPGNVQASNFLTPLAIMGANDIAFSVRKLGGFTFEELNVPMVQFRDFNKNGPDLTYDFFTRAEAIHPVLTQDVRPLRLEHRLLIVNSLKHSSLIHDLQNHDEITYQLINLGSLGDIQIDGEQTTGPQLKEKMLNEMRAGVAGDAAPFNKLYRTEQDGIATTFAGFIAPALGIKDPYHASPDQVAMIRRGHVLVAMANAMQPGVFGMSAWDLVGALPVPEESVADRTTDADWRWINRGGVDLLGANAQVDKSVIGLPKATALYGSVPEQLKTADSFASQLKKILAARKAARISEADMLAVPDADRSVLVLVMGLPDNGGLAVTALNYAREGKQVSIDLGTVPGQRPAPTGARDIIADSDAGGLSGNRLQINLDALTGRTIVVR
jgi:trehalose synthase